MKQKRPIKEMLNMLERMNKQIDSKVNKVLNALNVSSVDEGLKKLEEMKK